jgi:hypothetical protein
MEPFAPALSPHWLQGRDERADASATDAHAAERPGVGASDSRAEERALEELADRVAAARRVV